MIWDWLKGLWGRIKAAWEWVRNPKSMLAMLVHDAGHPLTGAGVGVLGMWLLNLELFAASFVATVVVPFIQEGYDFVRWGKSRVISVDSLHDIATYQIAWVPYLVMEGNLLGLWITLLLVFTTEMSFYRLSVLPIREAGRKFGR